MIQTAEELYEFAVKNGKDEVKKLLRDHVMNGQPDEFVPNYTTRAMCRIVGAALDKIPIEEIKNISYLDTRYGSELYNYMWFGEE